MKKTMARLGTALIALGFLLALLLMAFDVGKAETGGILEPNERFYMEAPRAYRGGVLLERMMR